jgi:hypothetical protein
VDHAAHAGHDGSANGTPATRPSEESDDPATGPFAVTATEYRFEGLPRTIAAGPQTFTFANEGAEPHELFIFRNTEGLSVDELFALGPVAVRDHVEVGAFAVAAPGASAAEPVRADLAPGEWEAICFVPAAADGRPHADHGMHMILTVR